MYHGLRLFSLFAINRLIGQLIEDAADRDAIRAARRFALPYREDIYRAATSHPRVLQLADTFPVAALVACADLLSVHLGIEKGHMTDLIWIGPVSRRGIKQERQWP